VQRNGTNMIPSSSDQGQLIPKPVHLEGAYFSTNDIIMNV